MWYARLGPRLAQTDLTYNRVADCELKGGVMAYKFKQEKNKSIDNALTRLQASLVKDQQIWLIERSADHWGVSVIINPNKIKDPDNKFVSVAYGKAESLYDAISVATFEVVKYNQGRAQKSHAGAAYESTSNSNSID